MDIAIIQEGIGHSKTVFGKMDAVDDLQAAEDEMNKVNHLKKPRPLEYLRIYRSMLNYFQRMKELGIRINNQQFNEYAEKAHNSSIALKDYVRHRSAIDRILTKHPLNQNKRFEKIRQLGLF